MRKGKGEMSVLIEFLTCSQTGIHSTNMTSCTLHTWNWTGGFPRASDEYVVHWTTLDQESMWHILCNSARITPDTSRVHSIHKLRKETRIKNQIIQKIRQRFSKVNMILNVLNIFTYFRTSTLHDRPVASCTRDNTCV